MLDLAAPAKEQLLLHQFLVGLPEDISKQFWVTNMTSRLHKSVERAKLIMAVDHHRQVAAVCIKQALVIFNNNLLPCPNKWLHSQFNILRSKENQVNNAFCVTEWNTFSTIVSMQIVVFVSVLPVVHQDMNGELPSGKLPSGKLPEGVDCTRKSFLVSVKLAQ